MTENQFIQELEHALDRLPVEERKDIMQDFREYFANGRADGKSDRIIASELGEPQAIAKELVDSFDFSQPEFSTLNIDISKDKFDGVDIEIENGNLVISPSADGKMHVDIADKNYKQQLTVDIVNRALVISLKEEIKLWGIFSITRSMNTPTLNVQLPDKLYEKIEINSENGSITGERLSATVFELEAENGSTDFTHIGAGSLTVNSTNGDISLTSIQAKQIEAETENGQLKLQDVQSAKVNVVSANGDILLKDVDGDVIAQTDNGRVQHAAFHLDRTIQLETDNGSILLETKKQPENATIRAEVDWGSISVFGSKDTKTVFGSGHHSIDLRSDNGSITVKLID
ncbi:DUF4097 family beta strand repeat-containing protein [Planococcus sp. CAU13]|uniref:DUF4097 family beta strand repeat-containing protein n=1 Tax=Planococcus sp. CAU13 TaxID=1541197 RepID=UPI00052FF137|nr:DUF4097 family beta strand repeat-containing protein [Planococcus sp. CAU13]